MFWDAPLRINIHEYMISQLLTNIVIKGLTSLEESLLLFEWADPCGLDAFEYLLSP